MFNNLLKNIKIKLEKNFHTKIIYFTLFAIICFDLSFIRTENFFKLLLHFNEYKESLNIVFKDLVGIVFIISCAIISDFLCKLKKFKNDKIKKMIIIGIIMIIGTIIKYNLLGPKYFGVIRFIIYPVLIFEGLIMIYIDRFKTLERDIKINLKEIYKLESLDDRISIIQYLYNEVSLYFDKIVLGGLFLGTAFTAIMSILWLSNMFAGVNRISADYIINFRSTRSICIGFGFVLLEIFLYSFKPLWNHYTLLRKQLVQVQKIMNK